MKTVSVDVAHRPYKVSIGAGLLGNLKAVGGLRTLLENRRVAIVSDKTVWALHGEKFRQGLSAAGAKVVGYAAFEPGEENKNLTTLSWVWDRLVEMALERGDLVAALGGGVVGDVAGFAAATYLRGVDFIQAPTTLLAMVDSSVGGKTGIDHPSGKNLLGAFHQPVAVVADTEVLGTLPERQILSGAAEMIKAAILADAGLFGVLERGGPLVFKDAAALEETIAASVRIKAEVVAKDEREGGPRALLNLGHTLGHAVEAAMGFSGLTHGEAVALGMVFAARLSRATGRIGAGDAERIVALLEDWGYPAKAEGLTVEEIKKAFAFDKKKASGRVRWVLPTEIGGAQWGQTVEEETIDALLVGMQGQR